MLVPVKSRPESEGERKELSLRFPALRKLELSNHFVNLGFSFKVILKGFVCINTGKYHVIAISI